MYNQIMSLFVIVYFFVFDISTCLIWRTWVGRTIGK